MKSELRDDLLIFTQLSPVMFRAESSRANYHRAQFNLLFHDNVSFA